MVADAVESDCYQAGVKRLPTLLLQTVHELLQTVRELLQTVRELLQTVHELGVLTVHELGVLTGGVWPSATCDA